MTVCAGSGIPRIKILITVHHGIIRTREWMIKFVATFLTLSSGVPLGHEAPTIFIAGGVGSSLARHFNLKEKKVKDLIYVGCSAGIAAAFNTPIAAVIFTLEEIIGTMSTRSMGPILISSLIASVTASTLIGKNSIFTPLQYPFSDSKELFFYLAVGIVAGFAGPLFINNTISVKRMTQKFFKHHRLTPILIAFCFASLLAHFNPEVMGSGLEAINKLLLGHVPEFNELLSLLILKFLACAFCYGSGMSGGIMLPIMFLGAGLGGLFGHLSSMLMGTSHIQIGAYCLVGMGAFFASVIRAPLTSIILVFEMTRDYRIVLPLMVANLVSYFIAEKIHHGSIYEAMATFEGYELPSSEEDDVLSHLIVENAFIPAPQQLKAKLTYAEIIYPDQTLSFALTKLRENKGVDHLKVVDRLNPTSVLGKLQLQHVLDYIARHHHSS
jgi:CIC family chloride channel protein